MQFGFRPGKGTTDIKASVRKKDKKETRMLELSLSRTFSPRSKNATKLSLPGTKRWWKFRSPLDHVRHVDGHS